MYRLLNNFDGTVLAEKRYNGLGGENGCTVVVFLILCVRCVKRAYFETS